MRLPFARPEVVIRWRFGWLAMRVGAVKVFSKSWAVTLRLLADVDPDSIVRIR